MPLPASHSDILANTPSYIWHGLWLLLGHRTSPGWCFYWHPKLALVLLDQPAGRRRGASLPLILPAHSRPEAGSSRVAEDPLPPTRPPGHLLLPAVCRGSTSGPAVGRVYICVERREGGGAVRGVCRDVRGFRGCAGADAQYGDGAVEDHPAEVDACGDDLHPLHVRGHDPRNLLCAALV